MASLFVADHHRPHRVAVIGHSGRGGYGHGLDVAWRRILGVEIVGIADPEKEGCQKALDRLKLNRGYSDYRKKLQETLPEFVSVAPGHPDQHSDMTLAAIEAGVKGIYVEKPFCRVPAESDLMIDAADRRGTKTAVAHRNCYHLALPVVKRLVEDGAIGF